VVTEYSPSTNDKPVIPRDDIEELLLEFGIKDCLNIEDAGGWLNINLIITSSNGKYLLKGINHSLIEHLVASKFPTPQLRRSRNGGCFLERGKFIFELFDHVHGDRYEFGNESQLKSLGAVLARFHQLGGKLAHPPTRLPLGKATVEQGFKKIQTMAGNEVDSMERDSLNNLVAQVLTAYGNASIALQRRKLKETLIHGDVHPGNFVFAANEVEAVFDYDFTGWGRKIWDVSLALIKFAAPNYGVDNYQHSPDPPVPLRLVESKAMVLLHGYMSGCDLSRGEIEALPDQMIATFIERKGWQALFIPIESHLRLLREVSSSLGDILEKSRRMISRLL
jgi:Ser/Thr protein kinase RdoA (MazF antagonist)